MSIYTYLNLDEFTGFDGLSAQTLTLSPKTIQLCLWLLPTAENRFLWHASGDDLTDSEWDSVMSDIALAQKELGNW